MGNNLLSTPTLQTPSATTVATLDYIQEGCSYSYIHESV